MTACYSIDSDVNLDACLLTLLVLVSVVEDVSRGQHDVLRYENAASVAKLIMPALWGDCDGAYGAMERFLALLAIDAEHLFRGNLLLGNIFIFVVTFGSRLKLGESERVVVRRGLAALVSHAS